MNKLLRFGVLPISFNSVLGRLIESGELDLTKFTYEDFVLEAHKAGFKVVEITMDMQYVIPGSLNPSKLKKLLEIGSQYDIKYTVHLPIWTVELASPNPYVREASIKSLVEAINLAFNLEPEVYVIHATGSLASEFSRLKLPETYRRLILGRMASMASQGIKRVIRETQIDAEKLAVENVEFPQEFTGKIAEENGCKLCFDTGHLLAGFSGEHDFMQFLRENYHKIIEIHLHDGYNRKKNDLKIIRDHLPLGEGDLPLNEFIRFLESKQFKGPIVFEIPLEDAIKSMKLISKLH